MPIFSRQALAQLHSRQRKEHCNKTDKAWGTHRLAEPLHLLVLGLQGWTAQVARVRARQEHTLHSIHSRLMRVDGHMPDLATPTLSTPSS